MDKKGLRTTELHKHIEQAKQLGTPHVDTEVLVSVQSAHLGLKGDREAKPILLMANNTFWSSSMMKRPSLRM